jgi:zinc transporter ZupT
MPDSPNLYLLPLATYTDLKTMAALAIFVAAVAGGLPPLLRERREDALPEFPRGQAFAAGVFLALSLLIMLPAATHWMGVAVPGLQFPVASLVAVLAFLGLLEFEHWLLHVRAAGLPGAEDSDQPLPSPPILPVLLTVLIGIPSFFLGVALGISADLFAILLILVAVLAHKGSAGFALALAMVRSTLPRPAVWTLYLVFALATPVGVFVGGDLERFLGGEALALIKATVLSLASGVFLYLATLHEMRHAPLLTTCSGLRGFLLLLAGFGLTALVRIALGLAQAHHL